MSTLTTELQAARAISVEVTEDTLSVDLTDGRSVSVPLEWYPRLLHGTPAERQDCRLIGDGEGIHWQELDEDISIEGLLAGRASGESEKSLRRWLDNRKTGNKSS